MLLIIVILLVSIILAISIFKYPMLSLVLFLMSSLLKAFLVSRIALFRSFDITVVLAVVVLIAMTYSFMKSSGRWRDIVSLPLGVYLLLSAILLLGVAHSSAPNYGWMKSSRFATLDLIAFLAPVFFAHGVKDLKMIIWIIMFVGIVFATGTLIAPQYAVLREESSRAGFLETNPLATAIQVGAAAIIAFVFAIMSSTSLLLRLFSLAMILPMIIAIILTGSRGPFLALVLVWIMSFFRCRSRMSKSWASAVAAVIFVMMIVSFIRLPGEITIRIANMWKGTYEATKAAESRTVLFQGAIEGFTERPIWGHGTGAWAMKEAGVDKRLYPHNIILELLYENGLIGATVLTLFFWLVFVRWRRASKLVQLYELDTEIFQIVQMEFLLFIFAFLQSMKSGDIDSNRPMFVYAGLIVVTSSMVRRIVENIDLSNEFLIMEQPVLSSEAVFDGTVFDSRQCE